MCTVGNLESEKWSEIDVIILWRMRCRRCAYTFNGHTSVCSVGPWTVPCIYSVKCARIIAKTNRSTSQSTHFERTNWKSINRISRSGCMALFTSWKRIRMHATYDKWRRSNSQFRNRDMNMLFIVTFNWLHVSDACDLHFGKHGRIQCRHDGQARQVAQNTAHPIASQAIQITD